MSKKFYAILPIIAIVFISGCTQLGQYDLAVYNGTNFTIEYPSTWNYTSTPVLDVIFTGPGERLPPSFGVSSLHSINLTAHEAGQIAGDIQSQLMNRRITSEGNLSIDGRPAFERTYSWTDAPRNVSITQTQVWVRDNATSTLYTLTGTSLTEDFDEYSPVFLRMIDSFEITSRQPGGVGGPGGPPVIVNNTNQTNTTRPPVIINRTNTTNSTNGSVIIPFPPLNQSNQTNTTGNNTIPNNQTNTSLPGGNQSMVYYAILEGCQEVPSTNTNGTGDGTFVINTMENTMTYTIDYSGLSSSETAAHIHGFASALQNAPPIHNLALGTSKFGVFVYNESDEAAILNGRTYVNIHSSIYPDGEIRGQITEEVYSCEE